MPPSDLHRFIHVRAAACMLTALSVCASAWSGQPPERTADERAAFQAAIQYQSITRTEPRPLRIHVLRVDLQAAEFELAVAIGEDPDGAGPVEATLTHPRALATRAGLVAAVNANPWSMIPPTTNGFRTPYVAGLGCDIVGWAVSDGNQRSAPQDGNWNFWLEASKTGQAPGIHGPEPVPFSAQGPVRQAVAGFGGLIRRGEILPRPSDVLHPRTAVGADRDGRWLWLVVVDGRQPQYSEGMSERELAELMAELGCFDAINLDGGGSSIMMLEDDEGQIRIQNRPSDRTGPRPVPVMLGVRRRT
jgi:exopolysaccharide biosynthesis protein